jgi:REP element-mobilizing transposase RayT
LSEATPPVTHAGKTRPRQGSQPLQIDIMSSTYLSLHYHLVFSTKNREPFLATASLSLVHEYLGGTLRGLGASPEGIGGTNDHVHIMVGLKATHCLADVMRELKKASSTHVKETLNSPSFAWQEGYAAFTVSATALGAVRTYIANQEEHHRTRSFREELIELLEKAGVEYNPKFLD